MVQGIFRKSGTMNSKKGQVSTEMIVVVGLVLLIFIPLITLVYFKSVESNNKLYSYQAQLAVSRLSNLANSVGSLGTETAVYTDVYLPRGTISLETKKSGNGGEIVLVVNGPDGKSELVGVVSNKISSDKKIIEEDEQGSQEGRWVRLKITSQKEAGGDVTVSIDKVG